MFILFWLLRDARVGRHRHDCAFFGFVRVISRIESEVELTALTWLMEMNVYTLISLIERNLRSKLHCVSLYVGF